MDSLVKDFGLKFYFFLLRQSHILLPENIRRVYKQNVRNSKLFIPLIQMNERSALFFYQVSTGSLEAHQRFLKLCTASVDIHRTFQL